VYLTLGKTVGKTGYGRYRVSNLVGCAQQSNINRQALTATRAHPTGDTPGAHVSINVASQRAKNTGGRPKFSSHELYSPRTEKALTSTDNPANVKKVRELFRATQKYRHIGTSWTLALSHPRSDQLQ
jgi:hypothetical protein